MTTTETVVEEMFQSDNPITQLNQMLIRYDLTPNQAKVYLFLSKIGIKTASEISKALEIPRTETYHLLSTLQQKGIIFSIFGKPTKFNAVGIEESIEILVNNQRNRIKELEVGKESIIKLWNVIPKYSKNENEGQGNKFQSLQGRNSILIKLEQMIKESKENILVLGTEEDFKKFYFTEFNELLQKTKSDLKILVDNSSDMPHIFEDIPSKKIKKIEDKNREDFCFIIKDDSEVIFFINNKEVKNMLAIWTDSKAFVTTLRSLFSLLWKKSHHIDETDAESLLGSEITYDHRLREIEQEKIILRYLQENFELLENNGGNRKLMTTSRSQRC
jgi:sugar-specific transcriptional regulator TrmB